MSWFFLALSGYFLNAFVSTSNKIMLRQKATTKPIVFTFYIGILSLFSFAVAPFGNFAWPGLGGFFLDILTGFAIFVALVFFYMALDENEASRVTPLAGSLVPILVLVFAYMFLGERLGFFQLLAFVLLILGGLLIAFEKSRDGFFGGLKKKRFILLSIILSAFFWISEKYIYDTQGFVTGFVWTRLGLALAAFSVLLFPFWRKEIFSRSSRPSEGLGFFLIFTKILAGVASLFINLALASGSVSLVNALAGAEYSFLLVLTFGFSKKYPELLKEKISFNILAQKIAAIVIIAAGLAILAFSNIFPIG